MCSIEGCNKPAHIVSSGVCATHYARFRKYGSYEPQHGAHIPMEDRFWAKVNKTDYCWLWTDKPNAHGYGLINETGRKGKRWLAHRYSWFIHNGEIPSYDEYHGAVIRHKCDNRLCVNPDHLELGTQKDNVKDMDDRGRRVTAKKHSKRPTHCKRGHELNEDNAYTNARGHKYCKVCKREAQREKHRIERGDKFGKPEYRVRTHCKYGHEFSESNTYIRPDGYKECRMCRVERVRRHNAKI